MIILLKVILSLLILLDFFVARHLFLDIKNLKTSKGYEDSTLMDKFKVGFIFYFMLMCQIALAVFLGYFIIMPMTIG